MTLLWSNSTNCVFGTGAIVTFSVRLALRPTHWHRVTVILILWKHLHNKVLETKAPFFCECRQTDRISSDRLLTTKTTYCSVSKSEPKNVWVEFWVTRAHFMRKYLRLQATLLKCTGRDWPYTLQSKSSPAVFAATNKQTNTKKHCLLWREELRLAQLSAPAALTAPQQPIASSTNLTRTTAALDVTQEVLFCQLSATATATLPRGLQSHHQIWAECSLKEPHRHTDGSISVCHSKYGGVRWKSY